MAAVGLKRGWPWLVAGALVAAGYLHWGWSHELSDLGGDSAGYVLAARYFSPFQDSSALLTEYARGIIYPPLFPLLIGLFGGSLLAAHLVAIVSLLAACVCLFDWMRTETRDVPLSAATALLFAAVPATYLQALNIWTENTFLMFSLLAVAAASRATARPHPQAGAWWVLTGAVACATLTRAAAIPILPAFAVLLALRKPRHWLPMLVAGVAPFAAWATWSHFTQAGLGSYTSTLAERYGGATFQAIVAQVWLEFRSLLEAWDASWVGATRSAPLHVLAAIAGLVCLAGWLYRLRKLQFDAIYVALYGAMLLAWPYPGEARRYGYVILPVLLGQGVLLLQALGARQTGRLGHHVAPLALLVMAIAVAPTLALTAGRFLQPVPAEIDWARRTERWYLDDPVKASGQAFLQYRLFEGLRQVAAYVPANDCVFFVKPNILMLYSGRIGRLPPPVDASDEDFARGIGQCRYAYGWTSTTLSYGVVLHPLQRLEGRFDILFQTYPNDTDHDHILGLLVSLH